MSNAVRTLPNEAQRKYVELIQTGLGNVPASNSQARLTGLTALASTLGFLHDSLLVEEVLDDLFTERGGLADGDLRLLSNRISSALLSRPWLDVETVLEQFNRFGIPLDDHLFQQVIHRLQTIDNGHPDPEGPAQLAIALLGKLPAASDQKFRAFSQLAASLPTVQDWSPTLGLVDGLLAHMGESGFTPEQEQQLERDIGDFLENEFQSIDKIHAALRLVPRWVEARPGMFSGSRLNLVKAQEIAEVVAALYEPTNDRWLHLQRVSEFLPQLPEIELYEAVRQILSEFTEAWLDGVGEEVPGVRAEILTSVIDCTSLNNALQEDYLFSNLIRCIDLGFDTLNADDMPNTLQHVIAQLGNPAVIESPDAYSDLLELVETKLEKIADSDTRGQLLDRLLWLTQQENLLSEDLRTRTLSTIAEFSQAPQLSET